MIMRKFLAAIVLTSAFALSVFASHAADRIKGGNFKGVNGVATSGSVEIVQSGGKKTIVLSKNFKTPKGPSLWIYLGNGSPAKRIGKLKSVKGKQTYSVPASVDISKYSTVFVYCKPFKKTFGLAKLK